MHEGLLLKLDETEIGGETSDEDSYWYMLLSSQVL
jgi:hypothetical protein